MEMGKQEIQLRVLMQLGPPKLLRTGQWAAHQSWIHPSLQWLQGTMPG
jgi:hypothetical protein